MFAPLALMLLLAAGGTAGMARAEIAPPPPQTQEQDRPPRAAMLDQLFFQLSKSKSAEEGKQYQDAIEQLWLQSGSPSIDILMQRGLDAFNEKKYDRAFYYFNEVSFLIRPIAKAGTNARPFIMYRTISPARLPILNMSCALSRANFWRWADWR